MKGYGAGPAASAVQEQHAVCSAHDLTAVAQDPQTLLHDRLYDMINATASSGTLYTSTT
jgi:hypothetical protein